MKTKYMLLMGFVFVFISCNNIDEAANEIEPPKNEHKVPKARVDIVLSNEEQLMTEAVNKFAFSLFKQVNESEEQNKNFFISPLSASLCLSMTANGAQGNTLTEIKNVLGFSSLNVDEVNEYNLKLISALLELDNTVQLDIANSIWVRQGFAVKEAFIDVNKVKYDATVKNLDFDSPLAAKTINDWCADKTNNRINNVLNSISQDAQLVLANALYFYGNWKQPFKAEFTGIANFTNSEGIRKKVNMMHQTGSFRYLENEDFSIAEFPYGNEAFSMVVFLPSKQTDGDNWGKLSNSLWHQCDAKMIHDAIAVEMPKFTLKYNKTLNADLKSLGMVDAFVSGKANFKNISDSESLSIGLLNQFTYLDVNESGTESAGVTIETPVTSPSQDEIEPKVPEFSMNRPFAFMIKEKSTGVILFMGRINKL